MVFPNGYTAVVGRINLDVPNGRADIFCEPVKKGNDVDQNVVQSSPDTKTYPIILHPEREAEINTYVDNIHEVINRVGVVSDFVGIEDLDWIEGQTALLDSPTGYSWIEPDQVPDLQPDIERKVEVVLKQEQKKYRKLIRKERRKKHHRK